MKVHTVEEGINMRKTLDSPEKFVRSMTDVIIEHSQVEQQKEFDEMFL